MEVSGAASSSVGAELWPLKFQIFFALGEFGGAEIQRVPHGELILLGVTPGQWEIFFLNKNIFINKNLFFIKIFYL